MFWRNSRAFRFRSGCLAITLLTLVVFPLTITAIPAAETAGLTAQEVRVLGYSLLDAGDSASAEMVADSLLARDSSDKAALMLKAQAAQRQGRGGEARAAARRVWQLAGSRQEGFGSALFLAQSFAADGRLGRGQYWLRRASQFAASDEERAVIASDYRWFRSRNPLLWSFSFSASPSSNVNGGSVADRFTLPGLPFELEIGGAQKALPGIEVHAGIDLTWRFHPTATTMTLLDFSAEVSKVHLSREARRIAPEVQSGDYDSASITLGVTRRWRPTEGKAIYTFTGQIAHDWYGGADLANKFRLSARMDRPLSSRTAAMVAIMGEQQVRIDRRERSADIRGLDLGLRHALANRDALTLVVGLRKTDSDSPGLRSTAVQARLGWQKAKPVGRVGIETWVGIESRDYPDSPYAPVSGRHDLRATLNVTLAFESIQYMGFAPTLEVTVSKNRSNVALFEARDLGLQLGFQSAF